MSTNVTGSIIEYNFATFGGGVAVSDTDNAPVIQNSSISHNVVISDYERMENTHCGGAGVGMVDGVITSFNTLAEAEAQCTASDECYGVYDSRCSGTGPYYMCQAESTRTLALELTFTRTTQTIDMCIYILQQ